MLVHFWIHPQPHLAKEAWISIIDFLLVQHLPNRCVVTLRNEITQVEKVVLSADFVGH